jgi:ATP-binding cassette subfamily B multidrug efflux pump
VLNHGRIHEQGTHDALMAMEQGIYQRLYLLQQLDKTIEPDLSKLNQAVAPVQLA